MTSFLRLAAVNVMLGDYATAEYCLKQAIGIANVSGDKRAMGHIMVALRNVRLAMVTP